jgi:hypothetical protein
MLFFSWNNRIEDVKDSRNPINATGPIQAGAPAELNHWAVTSAILINENESEAVPENSYLHLRNQVALYGVATLRQKTPELQSHSPQAWKLYNRMKSQYRDQNL